MKRRANPRAGGGYGPTKHGQHTRNPGYIAGQHWVECQRCGLDYRSKNIRVQWDGLIVCQSCWEPRHPQDFVRGRRDRIAPGGPSHPAGFVDPGLATGSTAVTPPFDGGTFNNELNPDLGPPPLVTPDQIPNLGLWWDMSDGAAIWADTSRTVPITNGALIRGATDKSGNSHHGLAESAGNAGEWELNVRNGQAAGNYANLAGNPTHLNTSSGDALAWAQPFTAIAVGQVPVADATDADVLMSHRGIDGTQFEIVTSGSGGHTRVYTIKSSSNYHISDGVTVHIAGEWYMWVMTVDGLNGGLTYNLEDESPPYNDHDSSTNDQQSYRFCAGTDTASGLRTGWNTYAGETVVYNRLLTTQELSDLFAYFNDKWNLPDRI